MKQNVSCDWTNKMLSWILANTYVLYTKLWNCHVNFIWPDFPERHVLLWDWKDQLWEQIDSLAEQIRKCAWVSPFSLDEFKSMSVIKEFPWKLIADQEVLNILYNDFCTLDSGINKAIGILSTTDLVTQNLLIDIRAKHDKICWFLRSCLWKN